MEMNWYLNVAIKMDLSLCELTLGYLSIYLSIYIYIYIWEKKRGKQRQLSLYIYIYIYMNLFLYIYICFLNLIKTNVIWILVYMF